MKRPLRVSLKYIFCLLLFATFFVGDLFSATITVSGNITYDKVVYTRLATDLDEATVSAPLMQAMVRAHIGATVFAETTTDNDGFFSLSTTDPGPHTITVYTTNSSTYLGGVGFGDNDIFSFGDIYSSDVITGVSSSTSQNHHISLANNSGAYNIFSQLVRGRQWFADQGHPISTPLKAKWPASFTAFSPTVNFIQVRGNLSTDPDEFDDDIILHEFGHAAMEFLSRDDSAGGAHRIQDLVDLRLSWSEGAAHYISSAIRGESTQVDARGSKTSNKSDTGEFDINDPSSLAISSGNEWAVANILWKAHLLSPSDTLSTLVSFTSLPASISSDPISLDTFHDMWTGASLDSFYADRSMSYFLDSINLNTSNNPFLVNNPTSFTKIGLSFFEEGDSDYFSFTATEDKNYVLETSDTSNGALTKITAYRGSLNEMISSNSQKNNLRSDTTSRVVFSATAGELYLVEVLRFNSSSRNYGFSWNSPGYNRTVGRYGSYSLSISSDANAVVTPDDSNPDDTTPTEDTDSNPTDTTPTEGGTNVSAPSPATLGGAGGGCFLKNLE